LYLKFLHFAVRNVFIQPPLSDTTIEWGLTVEDVYICDTKKSRDLLDSGIGGDPVANALQDFPQLLKLILLRIPRPCGEDDARWNAILRVRKGCIDQLVYPLYDDSIDFPWQGQPFRRDRHEQIIRNYLNGKLLIPYKDGKIYTVLSSGPKIILVDSRSKNKRKHPSYEQYSGIVKKIGGNPIVLKEDGSVVYPGRIPLDDQPEYKRDLTALRIALKFQKR